jgi:hypothetical protein
MRTRPSLADGERAGGADHNLFRILGVDVGSDQDDRSLVD